MSEVLVQQVLETAFSDETHTFRTPAEPDVGDTVKIRLRVLRNSGATVTLLRGFPAKQIPMRKLERADAFDWFETSIVCEDKAKIFYTFLIEVEGTKILYDRVGSHVVSAVPSTDSRHAFQIYPGFHVPEWSKGAVQYQILVDRFRNGDWTNDVQNREYHYTNWFARPAEFWAELPGEDDCCCFYGGDLQGVLEKLDYLQSLGVEVIYFNPIFITPSTHGYDTQDYAHINPHLTAILRDEGKNLEEWDHDNGHAERYINRTTCRENLEASDAWFAEFCREVHERGMRIILDGVFNHCGSFSQYLDREGIYKNSPETYQSGAYHDPNSPYRSWFTFRDDGSYHSWFDVPTLPKLYYEHSVALCEEILKIGEKWVSPPYSADGWRLDVAVDLGLSREFNHLFWKEFRRRVKARNPEAVILAEHYGDPAEWLNGEEWDTVMNYDAFMEPVTYFLTGMEKHSDYRRDDLYHNGEAFFNMIIESMAHMPGASIQCAMNELSNHDHSRFMTRTNGRPGRVHYAGHWAASENIRPEIYRAATLIQMTWPGAPTIYYGDEAGVTGWTDPDNRRTYPWGNEDEQLIAFHRKIAAVRTQLPVLKCGSVQKLAAGYGYIAYARFDDRDVVIVICNSLGNAIEINLPVQRVGLADGTELMKRFATSTEGVSDAETVVGTVEDGHVRLRMAPYGATLYTVCKS
ncbi:MAG: glycoside hydrolase family 13 protein [Clostridia bacterium]|nr:glycoside hydrolase family 13 protein [Clostridia bacterium]